MIKAFALVSLLVAGAEGAAAAGEVCPRQPQPSLIDSVRPIASGYAIRHVTFAASPSLTTPSKAWVVRAWRDTEYREGKGRWREMVEVIRLQGEHDCNRWFVTGLWSAERPEGELARLFDAAQSYLEPAGTALERDVLYSAESDMIYLDGTGISLEAGGGDWRLRRSGNAQEGGAADLSRIFHALAATVVPSAEMPTRDWR